MGDTPTENFLKRHQHWLLAILSALLLFLSFPNVNFYPFAWIAMVPLFIALTRATDWKSAFWIGYLTGFLFFAGPTSRYRPSLSLREYLRHDIRGYLRYDNRLSAPCRLYGALFCSFRRTDEVCTSAFRRTISDCRCLYLDSIWNGYGVG